MRETGELTFVVSDHCWRARLRARGCARSRGSRVVSTHGLNTQRLSAIQKVWSSCVCATISLQHGPTASATDAKYLAMAQTKKNSPVGCTAVAVIVVRGDSCGASCHCHDRSQKNNLAHLGAPAETGGSDGTCMCGFLAAHDSTASVHKQAVWD
jgi:hypothetical protein